MKSRPNVFSQRVFELAIAIPFGRVTTYGLLARAAGGGGQAARSITGILGKAQNQGVIPYHRIVYSNGKVWFAPPHEKKRRELYKREGIVIDSRGTITNFDSIIWDCREE